MTVCTMITNATIYDGSGSSPFVADIQIQGKNIILIGKDLSTPEGAYSFDSRGLALAPGFINTHSHSDLEVLKNKDMFHTIRQGITTEVVGQDGSSVAPVTDGIVSELADNMAPLAGVLDKPYWWRSFGDYLKTVKEADSAVKIEGLIGHGTIRMCVMGSESREPSEKEMAAMKGLVAKCMDEGAKGISFGLIYPPGSYAKTEELVEICRIIAEYDGLIMVHMRNEQDKLLESIDEMAHVARESGARLHISHLKALGPSNWGKVSNALEKIEGLRKEGLDVTFDQYPYEATCTGLKVVVPMWAYSGGEDKFQERLLDKEERTKILFEVKENIEKRGGPGKVVIAYIPSEKNSWMNGKDLQFISSRMDMCPAELVLHILKVEGPSVVAIYFSISPEDVKKAMKSPWQAICTDGIMGSSPHPRLYGSFPRVLGYYCRELGLLSLQEAIRKMTMEPARRLRLWDRGLIREGMIADLVLFDPNQIGELNSYTDPKQYPKGIKAVWIDGKIRYRED